MIWLMVNISQLSFPNQIFVIFACDALTNTPLALKTTPLKTHESFFIIA